MALLRLESETTNLEDYSIIDHEARKITSSIGRALWTDKDGSIIYIHKFSPDYWYLKKYNATKPVTTEGNV